MLFADRVSLLEHRLARLPSLLVALSGGVDSAVLLGVAARALPGRVVAATTCSSAVPAEEVAAAAAVAARLHVPHHVVETREMDDPSYRANRGDRCYFCRREMYGELHRLAATERIAFLADGLQADDAADDRPGLRAAREREVLHPLREAGLRKAEVRRLARALGLPQYDKPAQPCLASRLPVGVAVTGARLRRVAAAERAVRALGFREVRVRCEDRHGRIEIGRPELVRARRRRLELERAVREAGFRTAALDPHGYRVGGAGVRSGASPLEEG
ncbi:MAG: ATP-dependent sacrificial sulfur transferase LarE [Planctomycetota bacterium]|jgi:uncharacterized protein